MSSKKQTQAQKTQAKILAQKHAAAAAKAAHNQKRNRVIIIIVVVAAVVFLGAIIPVVACSGKKAELIDGVYKVTTKVTANGSGNIEVKAGKRVEWTLDCGKSIGTISSIRQGDLDIDKKLTAGNKSTLTFTPNSKGRYTVVSWDETSCCTLNFCVIIVK